MHMSAVNIVESFLYEAYQEKVSDIHLDPTEKNLRVRFRSDGQLREKILLPLSMISEIVGRIKILSQLRTDEHMIPQDGRFRALLPGKKHVDVRVSIIPSYYGESVVLRLLSDTKDIPSLSELGLCEEDQKKILRVMSKSSGMILVTGPTGSGKTTTLYTILKMLNDSNRSIITIEDPIEYALPGIRQVQTNYPRDLTFANGLRALVRQDPDIIMVGEIRDKETAHIAIHTALTGHLLLSTLHTSDAATAIPRLIDMGVDPYLIASTVGVIIGQRLIRKACPSCTEGCAQCNNQSYKGRIGIFEVLDPTDAIQDAIMQRSPAKVLRSIAARQGMRTMESDGLDKVERGITRIEEVVAAIIDL